VTTVTEIILAMRQAAPAGQDHLDDAAVAELQGLTKALMAARPEALEERRRFVSIRDRCLALDESELRAWLGGKTVLVTGGTGCIGTILLGELARLEPSRLVSVSRGLTNGRPRHAAVDYRQADVTNRASLAAVVDDARPDVVFHLAAQRDPGLAELEVHRTISTNIFGTRNLAAVAAEFGVRDVVCATSGKALRPYSREVYTAAKRSAEWILARIAARSDLRIAAVRFTHVVDNSIVDERLTSWAQSGVVRLHDPGTMFYAQSALESAQLMLRAGLGGRPGALRIYTINDLGWPIGLLDLALGTLLEAGSASPIYFSGHDPGYETVAFPGLYDPATAGEVSPLLSAFEAINTEQDPRCGVDACTAAFDLDLVPDERLAALEQACLAGTDPAPLRQALDDLCWSMLDATLAALPREVVVKAAQLTEPYQARLTCDHSRMLAAIQHYARVGQSAVA
jgi:nucleoside-diphosphate-sugar epimerase